MAKNKSRAERRSAFTPVRTFLIFSLISLIAASQALAGIRKAEISSFFYHPSEIPFFDSHYQYNGGVVPHGVAVFLDDDGNKVDISQLAFVVIDREKARNGRDDYDAIGIRWNDRVYELTTNDELFCPSMKFVRRGGESAFTIPPRKTPGFEAYVQENELLPLPNDPEAYVASEFKGRFAGFLKQVDLLTMTVPLPPRMEQQVRSRINKPRSIPLGPDSYVNADFHVKYQVHLSEAGGRRTADVSGLPLRYYWSISQDGSALIDAVEVFKFPTSERSLQYKSVLFFQTMAILRQFKADNPGEFNRFFGEFCEGQAVNFPENPRPALAASDFPLSAVLAEVNAKQEKTRREVADDYGRMKLVSRTNPMVKVIPEVFGVWIIGHGDYPGISAESKIRIFNPSKSRKEHIDRRHAVMSPYLEDAQLAARRGGASPSQ